MSFKGKLYDKRVTDRYIEKGMLKQSELDAHKKALPDDTANADWVQLDMEETDIGETENEDETEESVEE